MWHRPSVALGFLLTTLAAAPAFATPPKLEVEEVEYAGSMPKGAVLSPDGARFYVTNFGQLDKKNVAVYDAKTLDLLETIDVPGIVVESVLSHDGRTLYLSNFRRSSVMFVDVASKRVTREIKTGTHPKILALSHDGRSLFAANWASHSVTQIDVGSGEVVRTLDVGRQPRGMVTTRSGKLYVANFYGDSIDVFEGKALGDKHRLSVCKCPRHLALSPDEKTIYISCLNASQVHVLDLESETVVHKVAVGKAPKSVAVSRDGRWVWSADYGESRSLSVVDTRDWTSQVFPVPGMDRGSGVAVAPDGKHALVTGWYDGHVYLVGPEGSGGHPDESKKKIRAWLYTPHHDDPGDGA
jgi:YVTN family beta-propeller protein